MAYYTQVDSDGFITHRRFTQDPNFQPQEGHRILLDEIPSSNTTHHPILIHPVRHEADTIEYQMIKTDTYLPSQEQQMDTERLKRNKLLAMNVDSINVIEWDSLTDDQKTQVKEYRQKLLDVPQQENFPNHITWPEKPSFLLDSNFYKQCQTVVEQVVREKNI